jgi:SARP family transcriptional regulator, regulator of embCAB operon
MTTSTLDLGRSAPLLEGAMHMDQPTLAVHYLGTFQVDIDGRRAVPDTGRTRLLLAYLVDRRARPIPRDQLMDVFWPDANPDAARNSLHVSLCGVRKSLARVSGRTVIERRGETYGVAEGIDVWTDVEAFEEECDGGERAEASGDTELAIVHYEAGLALYGGDFLADHPYAEWALARREELRLRAIVCRERLSELYLEQGQVRTSVALCTQVLRDEPCHEAVARRLMRAYARLCQPHMALRIYHRCVDVLRHELGVGPDPETVVLAGLIRERQPV